MPEEGTTRSQINCILHPSDFSQTAQRSLAYAAELAESCGATLHLLHVLSPSSSAITAELGGAASAGAAQSGKVGARLEALLSKQTLSTAPILCARSGDADDEIVGYAEEIGADMIVMGTRGLTGLRRLVLGSVAESVLRSAPCPVLVVGPQRDT
jgi:universal stress protein A